MTTIDAVIIEDSRLARLELKAMLKKHPHICVVGEAAHAEEAFRLIEEKCPALLFLDIHLPGKDGFGILEALDSVPAVIFTTAYNEHAIRSFDYNTIDYLLKPISPERLERAINKALERLPTQRDKTERLGEDDRVFVKDGEKCWFVAIRDISLLESQGNYTQVHFNGNTPLVLRPLQHFESALDDRTFCRINRRQIVNLKYVDGVAAWFGGRMKLRMKSGLEVEVSRRQTERIRRLFSI